MSSSFRQYFTPDDISMLDRILDRAGIPNAPESAEHEARLNATRFLIASFQQGMTSEDALYSALINRVETTIPLVKSAGYQMASRTFNEAAAHTANGAVHGYRFGRRVETDGTWTIYHVFSGVPAKYGTWNMVNLSVKTADRALKILNAPMKAA